MPGTISTWLRIGAVPILIALVAWMEMRQPFPIFRLLSFVFIFFCIADLASLARGGLRDALVIFASCLFGLCVVEATARFIEPKQLLIVTPGWSVYEPVLGWGVEHPGVYHAERIDPKTGAKIYAADYTFDSKLLRRTISTQSGRPIVFFGDSFTFGFGVNDADTMPQAFADLLQRKQRVLNLAVGGFSPQQFLRDLQTGFQDDVIGPDPKLFVFMTAAWHAERTACKPSWAFNAPRYVLENGEVTFKGRCYEGWRLQAQRFLTETAAWRVFVAPYLQKVTHDDVELYIRELVAAVKIAKEKYHVATLIPYLDSPPGTLAGAGFTEQQIMQRLRDGGAIIVDVALAKERAEGDEISIPGDEHPTALANRRRAEIIKTYITQHMSGVVLSQLE
ncbi:SGNH/GDSL hydrolase family protein [Methylocella tundrae]|uniref:Uncharacterized protein n=1 Tax=Methylocella tundrae TaxID=227605 RepID=A0A4U8Z025_METTU|nr:SGNH/GDSL hydrolase family protein [Methylocella tundrae]WPP05589.1 SGNH/GDSL hydrolase family protein [Methylocella tundrae]VFU08037.1 conserved membrane protein of unknown function [Methylocella tundrae]